MGGGSVLQLRGLLIQLDPHDRAITKVEVNRICKELVEVGRRWPAHQLEDEQKAFDRLGRQLVKFSEPQQLEIVTAFRPLREDVQWRLTKATMELNAWLAEAPDEKASPERLSAALQTIEGAAHLHWYKQSANAESKQQFLMALASVMRAVQADSAPLHAYVAERCPAALALVERISKRYFEVQQHGNVLQLWHDGRLKCYNATLWRAAKSAADQFKDDLQVRLVTALRRKASQVAGQGAKVRPHLQLELCNWPMVKCPLANAFLDFIAQHGHELGDLGKPLLSECPPHCLRPKTLRKLLERLDAFELVDGGTSPDAPGIVRLRWEAVTALAFKALGTKPKASSVPERPESKGAPAAAPEGPSVPSSPSLLPARSGSANIEAPTSKAAPSRPVPPPLRARMLERSIPWGDVRFLQRLVRRGVRAEDEDWIGLWNQFCKQCRIQPDIFLGIPKAPLTEFVERNMPLIRKKEWAKDLLFKAEGQADELVDSHSDQEDEQSSTAATATRTAAKGSAASDRPPAAGAPPKAKPPAEQPSGKRPRATRPREQAPAAPAEEYSCSSGSDSSPSPEVQQQRKRKKIHDNKKKHGMLGYGDYFGKGQKDLHISPEAMMMNQYMGSMMMMSNPLYAAGMMPGMMPGMMGMVAPGMKSSRKDEKTKKLKVDTKLKGTRRERDRERERQPLRKEKEIVEDPRLNKAKPAVKPTPNAAKDAMIDAADL